MADDKKVLEDYLKVTNGQDLIDLGVVPKTSSEHLALITINRLRALRDATLAQITDEMLGRWVPAFEETYSETDKIEDPDEILKAARNGMTVVSTGKVAEDNTIEKGYVGRIVGRKEKGNEDQYDLFGIEWENPVMKGWFLGDARFPDVEVDLKAFQRGNKLLINGNPVERQMAKDGHGWWCDPTQFDLLLNDKVRKPIGFGLIGSVRQGKQFGHEIKITQEYNDGNFVIPAGITAKLIVYDDQNKTMKVETSTAIAGKKVFDLSLKKDFYKNVVASSLGQYRPKEKEEAVREEVFKTFLPGTTLTQETMTDLLVGLTMGAGKGAGKGGRVQEGTRDMFLHGPPGSGKSTASKDLERIAGQQGIIPIVKHPDGKICKVQCNPASLYDLEFAKKVPPCKECMMAYDLEFKDTGRFRLPKPRDVKVLIAKYGEGRGVEKKEGTTDLRRQNLAGYKLPSFGNSGEMLVALLLALKKPDLDAGEISKLLKGDSEHNDYDPEGFHPGALLRVNNGFLRFEEIDKTTKPTREGMLEGLQDSTVSPEQLRFNYPAHSVIIATGNDPAVLEEALNDRMIFIPVFYSKDKGVESSIRHKALHGEEAELTDVSLEDTHKEKPLETLRTPMPEVVECAIDALYIKFREEYKGPGSNVISGSGRSKLDALRAARAKLTIDQLFFNSAPQIAGANHAMWGINYAISTRFTFATPEKTREARNALNDWVQKEFPELLKAEENHWWCTIYRSAAVDATQIPEILPNLRSELDSYETPKGITTTAVSNFEKVKSAYDNPDNKKAQLARVRFPFMDYLFRKQPGMSRLNEAQLKDLMGYYIKSMENTTCTLDDY